MAETRAIKRIMKGYDSIKAQVLTFTRDTRVNEIRACLALLSDEWKEFQTLEKALKGKFEDTNLDSVDKIESNHFDLRQKLFRWEKLIEENNVQANNTMDEFLLNQTNFIQEISSINKRESEVTDANYDEVWEKIKARYDKRKHVVHALLKQFIEQPNVLQNCAKSLRHLSNGSDEVMRGLKVLGDQPEGRDPWLIYLLINKLDFDTKEAWAHETAEIDFPTLDQLFKFLNKRSDALESLNSGQLRRSNISKRVSSLVSQSHSFTVVCPLCSGEHYIGKCDTFLGLPSSERKQVVVNKKLCFNCLSSTHQSTVCRSRYSCRICKRRHHQTLHPDSTVVNKKDNLEVDFNKQQESTSYNVTLKTKSSLIGQHQIQHQAISPTANVLVIDRFGKHHRCRILLDSGSQYSFLSENCVQRLQIQRQRSNVNITGITPGSVCSRGKACILMGSLYNSNLQLEVNTLIISQLPSNLPRYPIDIQDRRLVENMELADPDFDKPAPIDFIIGADQFFAVLEYGKRQFNSILLQKTVFGWVVSGQPNTISNEVSSNYMSLNIQIDMNIDEALQRFWEIEEMPNINNTSPEDTECEEFYDRTHKRQKDGRYMVKLPFKRASPELGNSLITATQRFLSLERKLSNNPSLKEQYVNQIREYIQMGHMTEMSQSDALNDSHLYYLPHHSVIKETSDTTKVRVVFDGSSKSSTGVSLNETLMVGPTIQPTLWATLMRFRRHRIAITADIEKMYRQVLVIPGDTNYQRVLWRERSSDKIRHYKLNRVTFGLACSAYLAIRTLQQLARDVGEEAITQHILNDFYVDDLLSSSHDIESAAQLKEMMISVLRPGGFVLRKWQSNVKCLSDEKDEAITTKLCSDGGISAVTVLGLHWHPTSDILTFKVSPEKDTEVTKRKVISEASRVFDPLGFLAPSIVLLKILFQRLWFLKLDWDDKSPECYDKIYRKVRDEFGYFENIEIRRFTDLNESTQIHGFSDASEMASCAVVYSRIINKEGAILINILTAKTKVAPVKKISLPRLELCAAHLLTKLMFTVKQTLAPNAIYYAWTDTGFLTNLTTSLTDHMVFSGIS